MSATIVARDLSAAQGARTLFSDLDLVVAPGDVVGVVGANGAGKTTLLRLLSGLTDPATGTVTRSPVSATVGYLAQETEREPGETVAAFVSRRTGVTLAQRELDATLGLLTDEVPGGDQAYSDALETWLSLGGADLEDRLGAVLVRVGLTGTSTALMSDLSGGQASRAGLAALLLSRYDLLALDEPTNDLDLDGLDLLEGFVAASEVGLLVVSHDREFLARTVTEVVELDLAQQQVAYYDGGYDAWLAERAIARRHAREAYEEYASRRGELVARAQRQRNWLEQGTRNARRKAGKDPDKIGRKFRQENTEKQASKIRQSERMLERLSVVEEPRKEWELRLAIATAPRSGSVVAVLDGAELTRGDFTLGPVHLQLAAGDKVALAGPNGAGKTTLLELLLGRVEPTRGRAWLGSGVVVGEIDQARSLLQEDEPLDRGLGRLLPALPDADVRTLLAKFGLRAAHTGRVVGSLSPGERTRAALALLQGTGVNLLVLDEPTNHLDLPAVEQLELALGSYPGTLLLVTHDRRLAETVALTRRWQVEAGRVSES